MKRHLGLSVLLMATLPLGLSAQDYQWEQLDDLGVKYLVFKKLKQIPLKLGTSHPNLRARYEPDSEGDYIYGSKGKFRWFFNIYEFKAAEKAPTTGKHAPKSRQEAEAMALKMQMAKASSSSFREFVTDAKKDPSRGERKFVPRAKGVAQKANKGKSKLPYTWWEYTDVKGMTNGYESFKQLWYNCAAVYEIDGRQIAFVTSMPAKKTKLKSKHMRWAKTMLLSPTLLKESELADEDEDEENAILFKYAKTPERRKAVEAALENISALDNWAVFTTENYIVLYSWSGDIEKRKKNYLEAKDIAENMDRMRDLYKEFYPPEQGTVFPYSVMRICSTVAEFMKYGNSRAGVIGWFSPQSKELVLFLGNNKDQTKTVAFHEGWHQYADTYFPGVELHRWFDEGTGDFFGSYEWKGRRWKYDVSNMRKISIKTLVNTEEYIALPEIVTWNKDKFYGPKAPNYYAQGYAIVDFLRRGREEHAAGWDDAWNDILEIYRVQLLQTKNQKKAVTAAFENVDWDRFKKAWVRWVKNY